MSQAEPMSPNEAAMWAAIRGLETQLDRAINGWADSALMTQKALDNTDRSIAQTEEAIKLAQYFRQLYESRPPAAGGGNKDKK